MANIESIFIPAGGMNQDDSLINPFAEGSPFEQGDYRYALNLRIGASRSDNYGDAENIKSSLEITGYKVWNGSEWVTGTKPSGDNFPIGQLEDRQLRKIFLAYYSSISEHTLCYYDAKEKVVYEMLRWSGLNFAKRYLSMSRVGDFLVFTNIDNKPRIINYKTIHVLKSTLGSKFMEFHISFSKWAPLAPPVPRYYQTAASPSSNTNKSLEKLLLQFTYRYVFVDGFVSAWSPISNLASNLYYRDANALNVVTLDIPGLIANSLNPASPKGHNDQEFYEVVKFIEIAYRSNQLDTWKIFKRWPVTKTPNISASVEQVKSGSSFNNSLFVFDAKTDGTVVDVSKDFDDVPIKSNCVEVIDNRVMFGNNLDEHQFVSDVDFIENVAIYQTNENAWYNIIVGVFTQLDSAAEQFITLRNRLQRTSFKARGIYKFAIEFKDETGKKSLLYTTDKWIANIPDNISPNQSTLEYQTAVGWNFKSSFKPPVWAHSYQILRTNCLNISYFLYGAYNEVVALVDDTTPTDDQVTNPLTSRTVLNDYFDVDKPRTSISSRLLAETRKTKVGSFPNASRLYINVNNWIHAAKNTGTDVNFPLNKTFYDYREGDRVRMWAVGASGNQIFDLPILEYTGKGIIIERPVEMLSLATGSEGQRFLEVYRPKEIVSQEDLVFYEMGEWYPVLNPGQVSRDFSKKDWRWTDPSNVTAGLFAGHYYFHNLPCFSGDAHNCLKKYYYNYSSVSNDGLLDVVAVGMNPDKDVLYGNWERNNGRPNTPYTSEPLVVYKETQIKFGGKYFQDSLFNGINSFNALDQFIYPQEYGAIRELVNTTSYQVESVGSILLVIAENKPWSVYVNRTTLEDLGGRTQFFLSEKVLGSFNSLLRDHGSSNPESISFSDNGNVYWWSQLSGSWIRYGRDGTTAISEEYKMNTWFKELAQILEPQYNDTQAPWVTSVYDSFNRELLTCFTQFRSNDYGAEFVVPGTFRGYQYYLGAVFNEERNKWTYIHSYYPQLFTKINNDTLAIRDGKLYLLEGGTTYNNILGSSWPVKIEPVFNASVRQSKSWQSIAVFSTHKWSIERTLSEYWGERAQQQSSLVLSKFEDREHMFYSEFLNDQYSGTDAVLATAIGDKLRSRILRVMLTLDPEVATRSLMHQVIVGYIMSGRNVKS